MMTTGTQIRTPFRQLMRVGAAAVLALGLAACGGSSNTKTTGNGDGSGDTQMTPEQLAAAADTALNTAKAAVDMVMDDSNDATVSDAGTKLTAAQTAVNKVPEAQRAALNKRLGELQGTLAAAKTSRTTAMRAETDMQTREMAALGEVMFKALAGPKSETTGAAQPNLNALNNIDSDFTLKNDLSGQLDVDSANGGGSMPISADNPRLGAAEVKALDPVGAPMPVGEDSPWTVTDYEYTGLTGTLTGEELPTKYAIVTDKARIYSSRKDEKVSAKEHFEGSGKPSQAGDHDEDMRTLSLGANQNDVNVKADGFPKAGRVSLASRKDSTTGIVAIEGTYQGASGTYYCQPGTSETCTVMINPGSVGHSGDDPYSLSDGWYFQYDEGAMATVRDATYYYFGWWVREDSDGVPRITSATFNNIDGANGTNGVNLTGTATYKGPAIGQYAIHDPLNGKGDGGHFTADVTLMAKFGNNDGTPQVADAGVTGTIDGFRLKGGSTDPKWSVALKRALFSNHNLRSSNTVWSINGVPAQESGSWNGAMYFDTRKSSDNNRPDLILGRVYSEYGGTHRMVGAFGVKDTEE